MHWSHEIKKSVSPSMVAGTLKKVEGVRLCSLSGGCLICGFFCPAWQRQKAQKNRGDKHADNLAKGLDQFDYLAT